MKARSVSVLQPFILQRSPQQRKSHSEICATLLSCLLLRHFRFCLSHFPPSASSDSLLLSWCQQELLGPSLVTRMKDGQAGNGKPACLNPSRMKSSCATSVNIIIKELKWCPFWFPSFLQCTQERAKFRPVKWWLWINIQWWHINMEELWDTVYWGHFITGDSVGGGAPFIPIKAA